MHHHTCGHRTIAIAVRSHDCQSTVCLVVCLFVCIYVYMCYTPFTSVAIYCTFDCARNSINEDGYLSAEGQYDDRNQCH